MQKTLLFVALCLGANTLLAQIEHLHPFDYSSLYQDIYVAENDRGYVVGNCGIVQITNDGGENWARITNLPNDDFQVVSCRPGTGGQQVFIASRTAIYRSLNGGQNWKITPLSLPRDANDIQFPNDTTVFFSRATSGQERSVDNGDTWSTVSVATTPFSEFDFPTGSLGYNFSNIDQLYRSEDGGASWTSIYEHDVPARQLDFFDASIGYMIDNDRAIQRTTDGGLSWTEMTLFTEEQPQRIIVTSATSLDIITDDEIYRSTDSGASWTEANNLNTTFSGTQGISIQGIHRSGTAYWIASSSSEVIYSPDDLMSLESQFPANRSRIAGLDFTDDLTGYALLSGGVLLKTTDATSWSEVDLNSLSTGFDILVDSPEDLIFIPSQGDPFFSNDGGNSYEHFFPDDIRDSTAVKYLDRLPNGRLVIMGRNNVLVSDNDQDWTVTHHGLNFLTYFLQVTGEDLILSGGNNAKVYFSTNGGDSWQETPASPTASFLSAGIMLDEQTFLVSTGSRNYRSTDGGQSWQENTAPRRLFDFAMANTGEVFALERAFDEGSVLWRSTDAGASWEAVGRSCNELSGLTFNASGTELYAYGNGSLINRFDLGLISGVDSREEVRTSAGLTVYPNPTDGQLFLEWDNDPTLENIQLELWNLNGQCVYTTTEAAATQLELNLSSFPAGLYLLKLRSENQLKTTRVIIH
ncbi:MAG: YCF48-related protein [Bacteroidota bacterium]